MSTISADEARCFRAGTWTVDPVHSQVGFAVDYMVGTFRGSFSPVEATLAVAEDGERRADRLRARSAGVKVQDENLSIAPAVTRLLRRRAHARDRLRLDRHPPSSATRSTVAGELTIKGITLPVTATGTISEPRRTWSGYDRARRSRSTTDRPHPVRPELEQPAPERQAGARQRRDR